MYCEIGRIAFRKVVLEKCGSGEKQSRSVEEILSRIKSDEWLGAKLAKDYGKKSKEIAQMLVDTHVAESVADVNTVMETGFFHAYGPINEYF